MIPSTLRRRSVCALFMLGFFIVSASCMAKNPVVFQRSVGKGLQKNSPKLPETGPSLIFKLVAATGPEGPTVGLFGAVRVGQPYASRYGGRLAGAVQVVAVDAATGRVFHGVPERPDTAPLSPLSDEEVARLQKGDAVVESIGTYFHMDLYNHLGLPADTAQWYVFLWLDGLLSEMAQTPGAVQKGKSQSVSVEKLDTQQSDVLMFSAASASDLQMLQPGAIRLKDRSISEKSPNTLRGMLRFDPESSDSAKWISVLSLCRNTREFKSVTRKIPGNIKKLQGIIFEVNTEAWGACSAGDEQVFFTAVSGPFASNVLVME